MYIGSKHCVITPIIKRDKVSDKLSSYHEAIQRELVHFPKNCLFAVEKIVMKEIINF